ncbi:ATPase [Spongiactinospora gelatinilytica]|uniref:ATPase n=1 Tax=Spongiactinospora gelatinilytica TaxID=2666298 RepID=A0A2W2EWR2_9ACTN|nr:SRPBCC domain-containing protein [Spongiactinospora gelatinilytica]PZG27471.1 ATPase [Spongiactinospora gelatinilytica]
MNDTDMPITMDADDLTTVRVDQFLAHPPGKVWRALTEPELLARWLMPGDFRLEVGHRYTMEAAAVPVTGFSGTVLAEVLGFEAGRMLRIGWRDADPAGGIEVDWTITWTLESEGTGTRLFLVHEGFDPDHPLQQKARAIMGGGWRTGVMRSLRTILDAM